jgi:hypothetical protein
MYFNLRVAFQRAAKPGGKFSKFHVSISPKIHIGRIQKSLQ